MKCQRLFSLLLLSALILPLGGCVGGNAGVEPQKKEEPVSSPPPGMVETSRFEGHPTDKEKAGSDTPGDAVSNPEKTEAKPASGAVSAEASPAASDVKSDTPSNSGSGSTAADTPEGGDKPASGRTSAGDLQTLDSTSITARGENPWSLEAQKVEYNESTQRVRVKAIVWTLLDKGNKPRLTVRGRAADVNIETQNVAFDGPVEADGVNGEFMKVNHLVWDSARQKLLGSHGVRLVRNGTVMTGDNLTASPDFKQVEVSGNVRVTFADPAAAGK